MVITVTNQKGGVGKTTLSLHLAGEFARQGKSVKLIDMDPQNSALSWSVQRDAHEHGRLFDMEGYPQDNLHKHIEYKAQNVDVVIIDVPPQVDTLARSAIISADLVLIPVKPSALDIWAADSTVQLVNAAQIYRPELKCAFVLNAHIKGTSIKQAAMRALEDHAPIEPLRQVVHQRIALQYSVGEGLTIQEYEPKGDAAKEIRVLGKQIAAFFAS